MNELSGKPVNKIPRKPVNQTYAKSPLESYHPLDDLIDDYLEPRPASEKTSSTVDVIKQTQVVSTPLHRKKSSPILGPPPAEPAVLPSHSDPVVAAPSRSRWKAVVDETVVSSSRSHGLSGEGSPLHHIRNGDADTTYYSTSQAV